MQAWAQTQAWLRLYKSPTQSISKEGLGGCRSLINSFLQTTWMELLLLALIKKISAILRSLNDNKRLKKKVQCSSTFLDKFIKKVELLNFDLLTIRITTIPHCELTHKVAASLTAWKMFSQMCQKGRLRANSTTLYFRWGRYNHSEYYRFKPGLLSERYVHLSIKRLALRGWLFSGLCQSVSIQCLTSN